MKWQHNKCAQLGSCKSYKIMKRRYHSIYTYFMSDNYCYTTNYYNINYCNTREEKKTQENIDILLEHIIGNFGVFLYYFKNSQIF